MIIKSKNFTLRYPRLSDYKANFEIQQDKDTAMNFMSYPKTLKEAKKEVISAIKENKKKVKTSENFAIDVNGKYAGGISIHNIFRNHMCKITYNLGEKYRGKGIVSEAVKFICDYAFKKYKLIRIEAGVREYNKASIRILEKNGFKLEGVKRKAVFKKGQYYDDFIYAKVK